MKIDVKNYPVFQLYCGQSYFIVCVVDKKNKPSKDPVPWNDCKAAPTKLTCSPGS